MAKGKRVAGTGPSRSVSQNRTQPEEKERSRPNGVPSYAGRPSNPATIFQKLFPLGVALVFKLLAGITVLVSDYACAGSRGAETTLVVGALLLPLPIVFFILRTRFPGLIFLLIT